MSSAAQTLASAFLGLVLAGLLSAGSLVDAAERLELGPARRMALAAAQPVLRLSQDLGLDLAGDWGERWVTPWFSGRTGDQIRWERFAPVAPLPPEVVLVPAAPASSPAAVASPFLAPLCTPWEPPVPRPGEPLEVWFVGDSLLQYMESSLRTEQKQSELFTHDFDWRYSTGLARPDYFDWPGRVAERLRAGDPAAIVVMLGGNDGQGMSTPEAVLDRETEGWQAEYSGRVRELADAMSSKGADVFWIGLPVMRNRGMHRRAQAMNAAYSSVAEAMDSVYFVDIWEVFADDQGRYTKYLTDPDGIRRIARGDDGVHLSRGGTRRLARHLDAAFGEVWDLSAWRLPPPDKVCPSTEAVVIDGRTSPQTAGPTEQ